MLSGVRTQYFQTLEAKNPPRYTITTKFELLTPLVHVLGAHRHFYKKTTINKLQIISHK